MATREKKEAIDDRALSIAGHSISEAEFNGCVRLALRTLAARGEFSPNKTSRQASLDPSFLRRVMQGKRSIGLFTLFKIASASDSSAQDIVELIEGELRKQVTDP